MKQRVLITGGAHGIGKASAQRCVAEGYEVLIIDQTGDGIRADLSCPDQTAEALEKALKTGPITRLLNNVGTVEAASAQEQTLAQFDRVIALNLRCAMQCTQALIPGMTDAGFGRIVSIASRAALGKTLRSAYAASKAGLIGLSRVWALELGRLGITSNVIGPGPIATELFKQANPADSPRTKQILDNIPVGRMGEPEDVAAAVAFFMREDSAFVTGQVLYVCGGAGVGGVAT
ncbi:MAG: hypothetical protein RLZZ613_1754 [Pseudomonadota bacterium]|jgi:3-oxoacyl-[acyl-carrier protein] reductase|nr:SDR family oxidoreductase [Burkholderiaceae bacterium]NBS80913.1 SDR family oxidoreductase [Betaproteobacteria bacterium]NBT98129.1 SDR family oxidoreductase [Betaproteobacteria bacterium]NCX01743.1 SDR family oxidoreductase [Betaproteobacteria bacterium]NDE30930.1 SDR family oxidoreductase [Betaproteobacteria bacterium]